MRIAEYVENKAKNSKSFSQFDLKFDPKTKFQPVLASKPINISQKTKLIYKS
jgi:hypothetical protein